MKPTKAFQRQQRGARVRAKISGTAERPRLVIFRSLAGVEAQLIDDVSGKTLIGLRSSAKARGTKSVVAHQIGKDLAEKAKALKVSACVFDRNGYLYHGRVKALADGAREGGLQF